MSLFTGWNSWLIRECYWSERVAALMKEADELIAMTVASIKTLRSRRQ